MIICGYGLSIAATGALGIDQTYFGVELGEVEPNFVHGFPYDVVPHPMIIGSMVGLLGFHKMAGFRAALPYAIPMHCTMYFIHMVQEQINDIYAANWKGDGAEDAKTAPHRTPVRKASSKSPKRTPSRTPKKTTSTSSRTPKRTPSQKAPARKTPSRSTSRRTSVAA